MSKSIPAHCLPLTNETVHAFLEHSFAPWVLGLGMRDFVVSPGQVTALLPQNDDLKFYTGAICGQVIMAAIDTVASLAMATTDRMPRGTVYQHAHFLRPAVNDDVRVHTSVLRFGRTSAFAQTSVTFAGSGELLAQASMEYAF